MPNLANIVLADAQATPVNHTFVPAGREKDTGKYLFEDTSSAANPLGWWRLKVRLQKPGTPVIGSKSDQTRTNKVLIELFEPVMETLGTNDAGLLALPQVAFVPVARVDFLMHERSTLQNRKDLRKMIVGAINDALVTQVIENLNDFY